VAALAVALTANWCLSGPGQLATDVSSVRATVVTPAGHEGPRDLRIKQEGAGHYVTVSGAINHPVDGKLR